VNASEVPSRGRREDRGNASGDAEAEGEQDDEGEFPGVEVALRRRKVVLQG
jgi:hypothetical protein